MKITIAQGAFLPVPPLRGGAVEKIWAALGQEFARMGHEVTHISRTFGDLPREENRDGVQHLRVPGFDTPSSLVALKLRDLIYSTRVRRILPPADILVTHTFWLPILVRSPRFGALYVHAARYPKGQMRFYSHAARIQTVSRPIEEAIIAEAPRLASKVCSIPNPLSDDSGEVPPPMHLREKTILYAGRIHPEKGIHLLLEAFLLLAGEADLKDWKLALVGPAETSAGGGGPGYLAALQEQARPLGDRVEWTGPIYEAARLADCYRRASLFAYPSLAERGETFGVAPLEAMSHGCPPVVSALACFRDFIDDGVTGLVFNHRAADPARELASQLSRWMRAPECRASAALAARETANKYSLPLIARSYIEDFQSILTP